MRIVVAGDIAAGRRQRLWSGPLGLWLYFLIGRQGETGVKMRQQQKPFAVSVLTGALHCGKGCAVGDFAGEWFVFLGGLTLAGSVLWANYAMDFTLAFLVGIVSQCFAIAPMRDISGWPGVTGALKRTASR